MAEKYKYYMNFVNPPPVVHEEGGGGSKVTKVGYIPLEENIRLMMQSGQRLMDARFGFDTDGMENVDDDDIPFNPRNRKDYGFDDAHRDMENAVSNMKMSKKKAAEKKAADEAAKKAADEELKPAKVPA